MSTTTPVSTLAAYAERYFDGWNGRDVSVAATLVADTFEWTDPLLPGPLTSLAEAEGFFQGAWAGFPDVHLERIGAPLIDEAAGRVSQEWVMTGTHTGEFPPGAPPTGKPFRVAGCDTFTVGEDGRATEIHAYYDVAGLMAQLGLA